MSFPDPQGIAQKVAVCGLQDTPWLGLSAVHDQLEMVAVYLAALDPGRPAPQPFAPRLESVLRCVFGNPFRPVAFVPAWRSSSATALAGRMYESRDFGLMPILADALEDAGCDQPDVLGHCRGPGPHARGCWVVDAVLGKT